MMCRTSAAIVAMALVIAPVCYATRSHLANEPGKGSMKEILSSLTEIKTAVEDRQSKARDLARQRENDCEGAKQDLESQIAKSEGMVTDGTTDLDSLQAESEAVEANIEDKKKGMKEASDTIKATTEELKALRAQEASAKQSGLLAMKQVDGTMSSLNLRGHGTSSHQAAPVNTGLSKEVETLQELGNQLASMIPAPSFVQETSRKSPDQRMLLLRQDQQQLLNASSEEKSHFDEQEKELMEMIRNRQAELKQLEMELKEMQPTLADKLRQVAEAKQGHGSAERVLKRSKQLKEASEKRCALIEEGFQKQDKLRTQLASPVKIAEKLIETRDTMFFLSTDLQSLKKSVPAFLQVKAEDDDDDLLSDMKTDEKPQLIQDGTEDASDASTAEESTGPFDKVTDMMESLITSLQDQANEDVAKNQFCLEGAATQQSEKISQKSSMDTERSKARRASSAMDELDDKIAFCKDEVKRLAKVDADADAEKTSELKRVKEEVDELETANNIMVKVKEALDGLCELSLAQKPGAQALVQNTHDSKWTQCSEAAKNVEEATGKCDELTTALNGYKREFETYTTELNSNVDGARTEQKSDLAEAEAQSNKRAKEHADAKESIKQGKKDFALLETAQKELADQCGPGKDPRQARMDRREDEMSALKDALKVFNGEAVPVAE